MLSSVVKAGFRPDQARDSGGRWVDEGRANVSSQDYLNAVDALPNVMVNPLDQRARAFLTDDRRGVKANVTLWQADRLIGEPAIEFNIIVPEAERNKGFGSEVVKQLIQLADETGVVLFGYPQPFGQWKKRLTMAQLWRWYKKLGFAKVRDMIFYRPSLKAGFRPDQARGSDGRWVPEGRYRPDSDYQQALLPGIPDIPWELRRLRAMEGHFRKFLQDNNLFPDPDEFQEYMDGILEQEENHPGTMLMIMNMQNDFQSYGLRTEITGLYWDSSNYQEHPFKIEGLIFDSNGHQAGEFIRELGDDEVYVNWFKLYSNHQGNGFGTFFHLMMEDDAWGAGYESIVLEANLTVGGYAWAKMGFDFKDYYDAENFKDELRYIYDGHADEDIIMPEIDSLEHAWEFAAYEYDGDESGKSVMLGSDWWAVKYIWDDESGSVAEEYYRKKGLKAGFRPDQLRGGDGRWVDEMPGVFSRGGLAVPDTLRVVRNYEFPDRVVMDKHGDVIVALGFDEDFHTRIYAKMMLANPDDFSPYQLEKARYIASGYLIEDTELEEWFQREMHYFSVTGMRDYNGESSLICKSSVWIGVSLQEQFNTMVKVIQRKFQRGELTLDVANYPSGVWFFVDKYELYLDMVELDEFFLVSMDKNNKPFAHLKAGFRPDQLRGADGKWVDEGNHRQTYYHGRSGESQSILGRDGRIWLSTSKTTAEQFANIEDVYYPYRDEGERHVRIQHGEVWQVRAKYKNPKIVSIDETLWKAEDENRVIEQAKNEGYDAVIIEHPLKRDVVIWDENLIEVIEVSTKAGYRPDQLRGSDGRWIDEGGSSNEKEPWWEVDVPISDDVIKKYRRKGYDIKRVVDTMDGYEYIAADGSRFKTVLASVNDLDSFVAIRGRIYCNDEVVGEVVRYVNLSGIIQLENFELLNEFQGKGFGTAFYGAFEKAAVEAGFSKIILYANMEVGGYAWARNGYDFMDSASGIKAAQNVILAQARRLYETKMVFSDETNFWEDDSEIIAEIREEISTLSYAWEFAAYEYKPGDELGKKGLKGSAWAGYKLLDPNSEGWLIGLAYQESKATKAGFRPDQSRDWRGRWTYEGGRRKRRYGYISPELQKKIDEVDQQGYLVTGSKERLLKKLGEDYEPYTDEEQAKIIKMCRDMGFKGEVKFRPSEGWEIDPDKQISSFPTAVYDANLKEIHIFMQIPKDELEGVLAHEINHSRVTLWLDDIMDEGKRISFLRKDAVALMFEGNGKLKLRWKNDFPATWLWNEYLINEDMSDNIAQGAQISQYAEYNWTVWLNEQNLENMVRANIETHAEIARLIAQGQGGSISLHWMKFHEELMKYVEDKYPD